MTDHDSNVDSTIAEALRKAREGAMAAGYSVEARGPSDRLTQGYSTRQGTTWNSAGLMTGKRLTERRTAVDVDPEVIGVSVSLSGSQVLLDFPDEYRKLVGFPMAWLLFRTDVTDRLIARHIDVEYLAGVVAG